MVQMEPMGLACGKEFVYVSGLASNQAPTANERACVREMRLRLLTLVVYEPGNPMLHQFRYLRLVLRAHALRELSDL